MFHPGWVPPPPAPGAVWGCPVPPSLCLGGHNLTTQVLPPSLMIQHPFLGSATALVVPTGKQTQNQVQIQRQNKAIIKNLNAQTQMQTQAVAMVPCSSSQEQQQVELQQQQQRLQYQQQVQYQAYQPKEIEINLNKVLSSKEEQTNGDLLIKNGVQDDFDLEEFDLIFDNPCEIDALQQLLECDGREMEMNRNYSFTQLDRLA
eukprot:TRINITY_DN4121_c0_g1_i1.p1 TRINITY_DN4121_c0_g1~~TRINITY_DN4121_c0_g1_i1.p1  ORF type:complete len:236 (+),score=43.28 TRINITY_DN4121_c0_g1_i1:100-708(+)